MVMEFAGISVELNYCQAPLSIEFSKQEYWSGLPCPPPGDLPDSGTEPAALVSPAQAGGLFTTSTTWKAKKKKKKKAFQAKEKINLYNSP